MGEALKGHAIVQRKGFSVTVNSGDISWRSTRWLHKSAAKSGANFSRNFAPKQATEARYWTILALRMYSVGAVLALQLQCAGALCTRGASRVSARSQCSNSVAPVCYQHSTNAEPVQNQCGTVQHQYNHSTEPIQCQHSTKTVPL